MKLKLQPEIVKRVAQLPALWEVAEMLCEDWLALYQRITDLEQQLGDAAREINCAGPVVHRIRMLKGLHSDELADAKRGVIEALLKKVERRYGHCYQIEVDSIRRLLREALETEERTDAVDRLPEAQS